MPAVVSRSCPWAALCATLRLWAYNHAELATSVTSRKAELMSTATQVVGRERELAALQAKLTDACAGRGAVVMLAGEPGIGKTRTAQAFAEIARMGGATVLWGRCYEGDWSPPFAPWAEALSDYIETVDPARLREQLGTGAPPLAQFLPAVRTALPDLPPAAPLSPDQERVRLYDAVAQFLITAARQQPLVLILDDLHWADAPSLGLLRHLAYFVARAHLLVVGTYRDVELNRSHPLADLLPTLRQAAGYAGYERLQLRGLSYPDATAYLALLGGEGLAAPFAHAIYAETQGNPFYLGEVFRHLVEDGKLARREGRWTTVVSIGEWGVPEGVRQVVSRRLARLGEETRRLLGIAAAFTGGFAFPVLQAVTDLAEDVLLDCLDEALEAHLIATTDDTPARYDFTHALVRHTLYDALNPDRRARLHRRIAHALTRIYAGREPAHAAELAAQYHASAALPGAEQGIPYALSAAEQATAAYAHERAVTFLRMARDLAADSDPATRAEILCRLADAEAAALLLEQARRTTEEAMAALVAVGTEPEAIARFVTVVVRALKDGGAPHDVWEPLLERGLALVGDRHDLTWARLALLRDRFEPTANSSIAAGRWLGHDAQAVAIARMQGDEDDYARTLEPFDWRTHQETEHVLALARTWQRPAAIIRALDVVARDLIHRRGAFREAAEHLNELIAVSERYGSIPGQAEALVQLYGMELALGEFVRARQTLQRAHDMVMRLGAVHRLHNVILGYRVVSADYLGGDWLALAAELIRVVTNPALRRNPVGLDDAAMAALAYGRGGDTAEARRLLMALTPVLTRMEPTMYLHNMVVAHAAAAVWDVSAEELAPAYRGLALDLIAAGVGNPSHGAHALTVARMAALLGDMGQAAAYFDQARAELEASGQRPLRAIVDYDEALADIRRGVGGRTRRTALLDAALARFRALGMDAWAQHAARHLGAVRVSASASGAVRRAYPNGLTAREVEVLGLLAGGLTNKEIAAALVVSEGTVHQHLVNIYGKIGARRRADAVAYTLRHGLTPPAQP